MLTPLESWLLIVGMVVGCYLLAHLLVRLLDGLDRLKAAVRNRHRISRVRTRRSRIRTCFERTSR